MPYRSYSLLALTFATILLTLGCSNTKSLLGGVEVKNKNVSAQPAQNAQTIYVATFDLPPGMLKVDPTQGGIQGALNVNPGSSNGLLASLRQRRQPTVHGTTDDQAHQIVNGLAEQLIQALREKGLNAQPWNESLKGTTHIGWVIRGNFTQVDEGNRVERAAIGFGQGATQMELSVNVTDLSSSAPEKPFAVFDTTKDPGMKPGAIVTMNPYAAAAKFHMEKNATSKDIKQTASEIADEVAKLGKP